MQICLVRHAIAVERGTPGYEADALRPLTPRGRDRMRDAARGLATLFTPQLILTSPLLRARQTAEIVAAAYRLAPPKETESLANGDDRALLHELGDLDAESVLLVGHEPYISATLTLLLTGGSSSMSVDYKKGAAALISCSGEVEPGNCWLEWFIPPSALRALGASR